MEDHQAKLEQMYLDEFLRGKGLTLHDVEKLPAEQKRQIMAEASTYAATKVAEVETRARVVEEIHGVTQE